MCVCVCVCVHLCVRLCGARFIEGGNAVIIYHFPHLS